MRAGLSDWLRRLALLALCGAYLQGGLVKLLDFDRAIAEMTHFGLRPAALFAVAVIVLELGGAAMVLAGRGRTWAALAFAAFTVAASFMANAFWTVDGPERGPLMNAFFEHLGLAGAWLLVALHERARRAALGKLAPAWRDRPLAEGCTSDRRQQA